MSSKMPQVYVHLSNESSKILLQKKGIIEDFVKSNEYIIKKLTK
jgi:hypothetical protein